MAGIMLSPVLAVVSFFVVLRHLSFVGVGVAHSAFGGIALGFLLGISPTITAIIFAIAVSNAIGYIGRRGKLSADTAIGIFFAFAMALGVVFLSSYPFFCFSRNCCLFHSTERLRSLAECR